MCRKSPAISRVPIGRTLHLWHLQYGIYGISSQAHGKKERKPQLSLWRQAIPVDDVGQRQLMAAWSCYETQKIQTTLSTPGKWWVSSHVIIVITTCQVFLKASGALWKFKLHGAIWLWNDSLPTLVIRSHQRPLALALLLRGASRVHFHARCVSAADLGARALIWGFSWRIILFTKWLNIIVYHCQ